MKKFFNTAGHIKDINYYIGNVSREIVRIEDKKLYNIYQILIGA